MGMEDLKREVARAFGVSYPTSKKCVMVEAFCHWPDTNPSLALYFNDDPPHAYCYACRKWWSFKQLLAELKGETCDSISKQFGLKESPKARLYRFFCQEAHKVLLEGGEILVDDRWVCGMEYLTEVRQHSESVLSSFLIGCVTKKLLRRLAEGWKQELLEEAGFMKRGKWIVSPGFVVFPMLYYGEPYGFKFKRYAEQGKKDYCQIERQKALKWFPFYNFNALRQERKRLYLVEGEDDVLQVTKYAPDFGGGSAVGLLGGFKEEQAKFLKEIKAEEVIIALDNDEAGRQNAEKLLTALLKVKPFQLVAEYIPSNKDVDEDLRAGNTSIFQLKAEVRSAFKKTEYGTFSDGERLSNFVLELIGRGKGLDGTEICYVRVTYLGSKKRTALVPITADALWDRQRALPRFQRELAEVEWFGSSKQYKKLIDELFMSSPNLPQMKTVNYFGRIDEPDLPPLFIVENGYATAENIVVDSKTLSDVDVPGAEVSKVLLRPTVGFSGIRWRRTEAKPEDLREAIFSFTPAQLAVFAWFCLAPWYYEITTLERTGFPICWLGGERGSGKTTFATLLLGLYLDLKGEKGQSSTFINLPNASFNSIERAIIKHSAIPVVFDEYRQTMHNAKHIKALLLNAYDRGAQNKATISRDGEPTDHTEVIVRRPRAPVLVTSQSTPEDSALLERAVYIEFSKANEINPEQLSLLHASSDALHAFGQYLIRQSLRERFLTAKEEEVLERELSERPQKNFFLVELSLKRLRAFFGLSDSTVQDALDSIRLCTASLEDEADEAMEIITKIQNLKVNERIRLGQQIRVVNDGYFLAVGAIYDVIMERDRSWHLSKKAMTQRLKERGGIPTRRFGVRGVLFPFEVARKEDPFCATLRGIFEEESELKTGSHLDSEPLSIDEEQIPF